MEEIKIIVADDHKMIAEGITAQLSQQDGITVLETITEPSMICTQVRKSMPNAVLMDIRMGAYNGIELATVIKKDNPDIKDCIINADDTKGVY